MHRVARRWWFLSGCLLPVAALVAQDPPPPAANPPANEAPRLRTVQYDPATGWPVGADTSPATPVVEPRRDTRPRRHDDAGPKSRMDRGTGNGSAKPAPAESEAPPLASGTQLGSPLLDIYQATQPPGAWKQLGGVVIWWRLTVHGEQGDTVGVREVTHTVDTAFAERDRLEFADGRTLGRLGTQVYAERNGMPLPTATEAAQQELALFGTHARLPWAFGDANAFAVVGKDVEDRGGERCRKVFVEQRPPAGSEVFGPESDPGPRDRFEILYEPSSGTPREFVHRFASSLQTRRVLLEDWREPEGIPVRLPHRRVYVDESLRPTTTMEILRIERHRVGERDFRLR